MAREAGHDAEEKRFLTGRRGYMKLAAGSLAGVTMLTSETVGNVDATSNTVDLGEQGLSNGDVIDGYLSRYLTDGNEVRVPEGEYRWNGGGLSGSYNDAALVGDGHVSLQFTGTYWNASIFAVGGGDFLIRNVTIRGPIDSDSNKSRFRFDSRHPSSTITLDNFNLPDGDVGQGRSIGIYVGLEHQGLVHVNNCHVEGFPNNGLYAGPYGQSSGGGGRVVVENSFFKDNNIDAVRLGGDGDTIRNCVIIQNDVPAYHNGAKSGRGVRVRYPGQNVTIENVHITANESSPLIIPSRSNGASGQIRNVCIENNTGTTAVFAESGSWSGENIHVTGSGNKNVTGLASATDVYTGSNAESPVTSVEDIDGADDGPRTGGSGNGDGGSRASLEHTITIDGSSSDEKKYYFEVSGQVREDSNINPDDYVGESSVEGTLFSSSDSYQFSGEITEFHSDDSDDLTVYVDGQLVDHTSLTRLPNKLTVEGSGSYAKSYRFEVSGDVQEGSKINPDDEVDGGVVDGAIWSSSDHWEFSGEITDLSVSDPADTTVIVNGTEIDPSEFGDEPLPNRLVIDGSAIDGDATYEFEVSEAVEQSVDLGDLESVDEIDGTTVTGTIGNDLDGYRFAGDIVSMNIDGAAVLTIEHGE